MTQLKPEDALDAINDELRKQLLAEYADLLAAFYENRWRDCGLSSGRFCEVVFTVLEDICSGNSSDTARKPNDFAGACRRLESDTRLPDGLRLHATKLLPLLYDIRNRRDIGHVRGDIDPSLMDANICVSGASWLLAELVRFSHDLSTENAERVVRSLVEIKTPIIWEGGDIRRVAIDGLSRPDEALLLISSNKGATSIDDLMDWMGIAKKSNLKRILDALHDDRKLEAKSNYDNLRVLPLGSARVGEIMRADLD